MMPAFELPKPSTAFTGSAGGRKKRPRKHDDAHLRWIRTLPSVIDGARPCEAAHVRYADPAYGKRISGTAEKPDDRWSLPLTAAQHRDQHSENEREWWAKQGIDPLDLALRLFGVSGDDEAAEQIIRTDIERRRA